MYNKNVSKVGNVIFCFFDALFSNLNICNPLYNSKNFCSVYRVHGAQNDGLELTVSVQKSVLKNIHRVPRYEQKSVKIQDTKPNLHIFGHFGRFLRTQCIFFQTDFCVETVS